MGYTNYMTIKKADRQKFAKVAGNFKKAVDECLPKGLLVAGDGYDEPVISENVIWFNGDAEYDWNHETFAVRPNDEGVLLHCKTEGKPYDLAVCFLMLLFKYEYKDDVEMGSDGIAEEHVELDTMESQCMSGKYNWPLAYFLFKTNFLNKEETV